MVVARCCKEAIQKAKKNQFVQPAEDPKVGFISLASTMVGINNCLKSSVVSNLFGDELGLHDFNPESHDSSAINRGPSIVRINQHTSRDGACRADGQQSEYDFSPKTFEDCDEASVNCSNI